ncbi:uncharacterized protein J8A68_003788 [[Candida] subhashii]|uniref:Hyphally-regulated cell wall protein N-terminal domain-containing protein n=1 Tax=[Candida] subhashii TaxID=561895 RepID=A0A8J5UGR6_9ASCO|nr:uncharacterized protein J8A68_003788 [[Candida] subhashii]KAG7662658.1 hypothetical protein J8A68_003788 [[Candida] subhashii]
MGIDEPIQRGGPFHGGDVLVETDELWALIDVYDFNVYSFDNNGISFFHTNFPNIMVRYQAGEIHNYGYYHINTRYSLTTNLFAIRLLDNRNVLTFWTGSFPGTEVSISELNNQKEINYVAEKNYGNQKATLYVPNSFQNTGVICVTNVNFDIGVDETGAIGGYVLLADSNLDLFQVSSWKSTICFTNSQSVLRVHNPRVLSPINVMQFGGGNCIEADVDDPSNVDIEYKNPELRIVPKSIVVNKLKAKRASDIYYRFNIGDGYSKEKFQVESMGDRLRVCYDEPGDPTACPTSCDPNIPDRILDQDPVVVTSTIEDGPTVILTITTTDEEWTTITFTIEPSAEPTTAFATETTPETTSEFTTETPEETTTEITTETPEETATEITTETPEETATEITIETPAEATTEIIPETTPDTAPETTTGLTTETPSETTTELTTETSSETTTELTTEASTETTPDITPATTSETTPETTLETSIGTIPVTNPEIVTETPETTVVSTDDTTTYPTTDTTPEATSETASEVSTTNVTPTQEPPVTLQPETTLETITETQETTSGSTVDTKPDSATDITPETTSETASEVPTTNITPTPPVSHQPETTPGTDPETTATTPAATPQTHPETSPATTTEATPGTDPESTTDTTSEATPESSTETTTPTAQESTSDPSPDVFPVPSPASFSAPSPETSPVPSEDSPSVPFSTPLPDPTPVSSSDPIPVPSAVLSPVSYPLASPGSSPVSPTDSFSTPSPDPSRSSRKPTETTLTTSTPITTVTKTTLSTSITSTIHTTDTPIPSFVTVASGTSTFSTGPLTVTSTTITGPVTVTTDLTNTTSTITVVPTVPSFQNPITRSINSIPDSNVPPAPIQPTPFPPTSWTTETYTLGGTQTTDTKLIINGDDPMTLHRSERTVLTHFADGALSTETFDVFVTPSTAQGQIPSATTTTIRLDGTPTAVTAIVVPPSGNVRSDADPATDANGQKVTGYSTIADSGTISKPYIPTTITSQVTSATGPVVSPIIPLAGGSAGLLSSISLANCLIAMLSLILFS